jgi:hypothetical protein
MDYQEGFMISLPVIEKLVIKNYALYPGKENAGLDIEFTSGVSVLAGINGVGKTTLLNLLLRMILGAANPKASADISRVSKRELLLPKKFDFFSKRVPFIDNKSVATIDFRIGDNSVKVTRFLGSMLIKSAFINNVEVKPESEVRFIEDLANIAGMQSAYDFHLVVRYLQFFTEERLPILWSSGIQFEFLKMLFTDEETAKGINTIFAKIQRVDTDYRNGRNQLTLRQGKLRQSSTPLSVEIATLDKLIIEADKVYIEADSAFQTSYQQLKTLQAKTIDLDNKAGEAEAILLNLEKEFSKDDALFIASVLPNLEDKLKFLMQGLGAKAGCFVCGKRGRKESQEISRKLRHGHCFVCNANVGSAHQDNVTPITAKKVIALENEIFRLKKELEKIDSERTENENLCLATANEVRNLATQRTLALQELTALKAQRPSQDKTNDSDLAAELKREEDALNILDVERKELTEQFRRLVTLAQESVEKSKEKIRNKMTNYSQAFLQEDVNISLKRQTPFLIATGAGKVNIPSFVVHMTSSTYVTPEERLSTDSVSESQKEFLDLAFRMALLDLITEDQPVMMIIETPEASLDSWFMMRAASLMRQFAPDSSSFPRKLIATSNLNGTTMIPALLGLCNEEGVVDKKINVSDPHLINLMELTAEAKALKNNKAKDIFESEFWRFADV